MTARRMFRELVSGLRLPVMQAPMFLVTGPAMVVAACRAGIVGSFPTQNARTIQELEGWLNRIVAALLRPDGSRAPWAVNLITHPTYARGEADLELLARYRPPIVVTALGSPARALETVHGYGGLVFADVTTVALGRKAVQAGADGLVLVCAGAGGHTGVLSPFAFVDAVREFWDGPLVLGGGVATGCGIHAAIALGADLAYVGTRFLATAESLAADAYKEMVVAATAEDIVCSDAITGVRANWLRQSLRRAGYDPDAMPARAALNVSDAVGAKRWKDIWSAGQSVGAVRATEPLAAAVETLHAEYVAARNGAAAPLRGRRITGPVA